MDAFDSKPTVISPAGEAILAVVRGKWRVLFATLLGALIGLGIAYLMPEMYRAQARLLPPQVSSTTASNMLSSIGGAGELAASAAGLKNPAELYIGILRSRAVVSPIIENFKLTEHYRAKSFDDAEKIMQKRLQTTLGKEGILEIEITDESPSLAVLLTNGIIDQLYATGRRLSADERERREHFYAPWLQSARNQLNDAEAQLLKTEQKTGLSRMKGQEEASVITLNEIQSQLTTAQSMLEAIRGFATEENPDLQRMKSQIEVLQNRKKQMLSEGNKNPMQIDMSKGIESIDEVNRLRRDVRLRENVLEMVMRASEFSKVDETRDVSLIKVLDRATLPERPIGPRKMIAVILGALVGFTLATGFIFITHHLRQRRGGAGFLSALRSALLYGK